MAFFFGFFFFEIKNKVTDKNLLVLTVSYRSMVLTKSGWSQVREEGASEREREREMGSSNFLLLALGFGFGLFAPTFSLSVVIAVAVPNSILCCCCVVEQERGGRDTNQTFRGR